MVIVKKKPGESEDKLISRFRKMVAEEEIVETIRKRQRWISKGEIRKERNKRVEIIRKQAERKNR